MSRTHDIQWENWDFIRLFLFFRIKPQLSHWILWVLDMWSLPTVYLIEPIPDYKLVFSFALLLIKIELENSVSRVSLNNP